MFFSLGRDVVRPVGLRIEWMILVVFVVQRAVRVSQRSSEISTEQNPWNGRNGRLWCGSWTGLCSQPPTSDESHPPAPRFLFATVCTTFRDRNTFSFQPAPYFAGGWCASADRVTYCLWAVGTSGRQTLHLISNYKGPIDCDASKQSCCWSNGEWLLLVPVLKKRLVIWQRHSRLSCKLVILNMAFRKHASCVPHARQSCRHFRMGVSLALTHSPHWPLQEGVGQDKRKWDTRRRCCPSLTLDIWRRQ